MEFEDDTQHPENHLKIEKMINEQWVCTGWAQNEKAFRQHATAIGGTVRCLSSDGSRLLFTVTEKVPASIDNCD